MRLHSIRGLLLCSGALAIAGCGGGGGGGTNFIPPPPVTPAPPPAPKPTSEAVEIFQNPATQEFVTASAGAPLRIRYDASTNHYEVMAGNLDWTTLVDDSLSAPNPGSPNVNFRLDGIPQSFFMIRTHYSYPNIGYKYSNLAAWAVPATAGGAGGVGGLTAFGIATPQSGVPVTGSASYQGMIEGSTTFQCVCGWDGEMASASMEGTVSLSFDFAKGSLSGALQPQLYAEKFYTLPKLTFTNTVFGVGSQTFSGSFATNLSGPNSFSGQFTGPNAEELIGKWTFPFASPTDGSAQSAAGAMIAKQP